MRALVVDDSMTIRKIIAKTLGDLGCGSTDEAADGAEAVAVAQRGGFDVILMDWNMPTMSGIEAVKAIRATGDRTPVLMVTTEGEKLRVIEAIKAGANDYLVKPFTPDQLAAKVRGVIGARAV